MLRWGHVWEAMGTCARTHARMHRGLSALLVSSYHTGASADRPSPRARRPASLSLPWSRISFPEVAKGDAGPQGPADLCTGLSFLQLFLLIHGNCGCCLCGTGGTVGVRVRQTFGWYRRQVCFRSYLTIALRHRPCVCACGKGGRKPPG